MTPYRDSFDRVLWFECWGNGESHGWATRDGDFTYSVGPNGCVCVYPVDGDYPALDHPLARRFGSDFEARRAVERHVNPTPEPMRRAEAYLRGGGS
ncbi:MAG: hypothetical protein AAFY08_13030 [Planctomycetota bacterium]